jgi:alcohol-forming fatty acyl-CoA reductase
LKDAIAINILGTKKIIDIALLMENLKAFVHVSTIFSNCNREEIDEKIYGSVLSYHQLIQIGKVYENLKDSKQVDDIIYDNLPNTYTLTKHHAEKLVYHQSFFLPSGIFRPPIVISSYKDFPGYTDNLNGPSGIIAWTARGIIHCIPGDPEVSANLVPVDFCINALIIAAWDISER